MSFIFRIIKNGKPPTPSNFLVPQTKTHHTLFISPFPSFITISFPHISEEKGKNKKKKLNLIMEGLLPLVYKAIKRSKTRSQYECLSSGSALGYNISMAEMYPQTQDHTLRNQTAPHKVFHHHHEDHRISHRRHNSVGDFGNGFHSPQMRTGVVSTSSNKLVRFRSQRLFSCITGVWGCFVTQLHNVVFLIQTILWILIMFRFHFENWFYGIEIGENLKYKKLCTLKVMCYAFLWASRFFGSSKNESLNLFALCLGVRVVKFNFWKKK